MHILVQVEALISIIYLITRPTPFKSMKIELLYFIVLPRIMN